MIKIKQKNIYIKKTHYSRNETGKIKLEHLDWILAKKKKKRMDLYSK